MGHFAMGHLAMGHLAPGLLAAALLAGAGCSEASPAPIDLVPEPATESATAPSRPPTGEASVPVAEAEPAEASPPTDTEEVAADEVADAIDSTRGVATVIESVDRGRRRYVLFTFDGARAARAEIEAGPDGALRADAIEDGLDRCEEDNDDYSVFSCLAEVAPDAYLAAARLCGVHGWGIAVLERRGAAWVRVARRTLYALSCDEGEAVGERASLRVRDLDGDGAVELMARVPIVGVRADRGLTGGTEGVVAHVLDEALRTQLVLTSHIDELFADVGGTERSCRAAWRLTDIDGDGHDDVRVRETCDGTDVDEIEGPSPMPRSARDVACPWVAASDTWVCPTPVGRWLFEGSDALIGETVADVGLTLGARTETVVREYRTENEDAPGDSESARAPGSESAPGSSSSPAPASPAPSAGICALVVDDPAPPLRVRAAPAATAEAVGELANGVEVSPVEVRGAWTRIDAPRAGWVFTAKVRRRCPPRAP